MPATEWGWLITTDELHSWIIEDTPDLLLINKPALVVCHPSKHGPWSSLIGACREYTGLDPLHLPCRLDRETSGVVVLAKNRHTASRLQSAIQQRLVRKTYYAVLTGHLAGPVTVDQPLGRDPSAVFACRQWVIAEGSPAQTEFVPLAARNGYTLARVHPYTGRLHQIRVHAAWLGHAVAGDKLYGPDQSLMMEFLEHGFSPRLAAALPLPRHALHAAEVVFETEPEQVFQAPLTADLTTFCQEKLGISV